MEGEMAEYPAGRPFRGRRPTHPGAILREDVLPALRMSVTEAAEKLGISRQMLHGILAEKHAVSPEMAVRLGKFCGNGPGIWLRMQQAHDLWQAERDLAKAVAQIKTQSAA
jgi:antitoxin HigA-1